MASQRRTSWYRRFGKRGLDLVLGALLLCLAAPLLAVLCVLVRLRMGSPVFFVQQRPGRGTTPFPLRKLRTMTSELDRNGSPLPDAERLTPLGRFLRRTSLDEIPEILNVLRGEMSLVGPRPLLMDYLPLYSKDQARRHEVRPGITGLAQVSGRNALSWPEKLALDVKYVDHSSLGLDLSILARTFWIVVSGHGVAAEGSATMPRFQGETHEEDQRST